MKSKLERTVDALLIVSLTIMLICIARDVDEGRRLKRQKVIMEIELLELQLEAYDEACN